MNENSHIPNQANWQKLLDFLEQEERDENLLSPAERAQLVELKRILAETNAALSDDGKFNSDKAWGNVKAQLNLTGQDEQEVQQQEEDPNEKTRAIKIWPRIIAIAAAVAFIIIGIQFFRSGQQKNTDQTNNFSAIKPGTNGASITLANGKVIQLSGSKSGVIVGEDLKYSDGSPAPSLSQSDISPSGSEQPIVQMLTAQTAKGQTYEFVLPDGSHVFLNADSKIIFPSQFIEKNRKIMVQGEAYFEVAKDKKHPFVVHAKDQEVNVLGTHFNINSYSDEPNIKTTLVEGSVRVSLMAIPTANEVAAARASQPRNDVILKPGEQSQVDRKSIKVVEVNTDKAIAWKNGKFIFDEESIQSVMRKLSRWYNIEVVYEGDFSDIKFVGSISRSDDIKKILNKITFTQAVKFKAEGRRIYVRR